MEEKSVNTVASKGNRWDLVEEVLIAWVKRHPNEWREFLAAQAQRRAELEDPKYARNKTGSMREIGSFPYPAVSIDKNGKQRTDDLTQIIQKVIPEFWSKGEVGRNTRAEFFNRFKAFKLPESV